MHFLTVQVHFNKMYLLVVKQYLFAFKSFKYSELGYYQNWDHKATQNLDWSLNLQFDFIKIALLGISVTTEAQIPLMRVITALQLQLECLFKNLGYVENFVHFLTTPV